MNKSLPILLALILNISPVFANETISFQINNETNLNLVKCTAGSFNMGSPDNELGRIANSEYSINNALINQDFYIGKYEITQAQYNAVMGQNPSKNQGDNKPVERITYYDCIDFCKKLNELTEKNRPSGYEFTLPTEIQWEYAARAGTTTSLNNGKNLSQAKGVCNELDDIAWYKANSETKTHAVGLKKSNLWGIYDMHGNVAEWCLDAFNNNAPSLTINNESKCAIRGGAYFYEPEKLRSASRGANPPNTISSGIGFRVALVNNTDENQITTAIVSNQETKDTPKETSVTSQVTDTSDDNHPTINQNPIEQTKPTITEVPDKPVKAGEKISVSINGVKFPLIGCPSGNYVIGSPENEIGRNKNENQHKITIDKGFYIGKYEITQGQYKAIMGNNPSVTTGDKLPVHNINYLDAEKFCQKLNELTKDKRPANYDFAIPTEEQWEYACRAGYSTSLNNGKNLKKSDSSDNELNKIAWYEANACGVVQTVGKKIANPWGIHDMLGNICEWCSNDINPSNNDEFKTRIVRGGGFKSKSKDCRNASRNETKENNTSEFFGFRIILKHR